MGIPEIIYDNGGFIILNGVNLNRGADTTPISPRRDTTIVPVGLQPEEGRQKEIVGQAEASSLASTDS